MNLYVLVAIAIAFGLEPKVFVAPFQIPVRLGVLACGLAGLGLLANWLSRWTAQRLHNDFDKRDRILSQYLWLRRLYCLLALVVFGFAVQQLGWNWIVRNHWGLQSWFVVPDLLVLAPYLVGELIAYSSFYLVDRQMRRMLIAQGLSSQPVWTRGQYINFQLRGQLGIWVLASLVMLTLRDTLTWLIPGWTQSPEIALIAMTLMSMAVMTLSPLIIRFVWGASPLPDGPLRKTLLEIARRTGFRCSNILIWRTHRGIVNAAVAGLFPQLRYVLLSDALMEQLTPQEVGAVFGHEVGHIRHHHLSYYLFFLIASVVLISLLTPYALDLLEVVVGADAWPYLLSTFQFVPLDLLLLLPYFGVVFGFLSRRFERQADVFGSRAASHLLELDGADNSASRENNAPLPVSSEGVCLFVSSLEKVGSLNGMTRQLWSWRHGSIARRVAFLQRIARDPHLADRFDLKVRYLRWTLTTVLITGIAGLTLLEF